MSSLLPILAIFAAVALGVFVIRFRRLSKNTSITAVNKAYKEARLTETDSLSRFFIDSSKSFTGLPIVSDKNSSIYQIAQARLLAAGGAYGNSVEVFLSTQAFTIVLGIVIILLTASGLLGAVLGTAGLIPVLLGVLLGCSVAVLPWWQVDKRAKKRTDEVNSSLPEFAELLQMPLTAGLSILAAMDFTASHSYGPVSVEAKNVIMLINTRALSPQEAFNGAGDRLGTPEAKSFFNSLGQAYVEGSKIISVIRGQAASLRKAQYQRQRTQLKKLPIKLILIFAIHFLPAMFVIIFFSFAGAFRGL